MAANGFIAARARPGWWKGLWKSLSYVILVMLSGSSQIHLKRLAKLVYDTMLVYVDFPFFFPCFDPYSSRSGRTKSVLSGWSSSWRDEPFMWTMFRSSTCWIKHERCQLSIVIPWSKNRFQSWVEDLHLRCRRHCAWHRRPERYSQATSQGSYSWQTLEYGVLNDFDCIFWFFCYSCSSNSCKGVKQSRLCKAGGTYCISADIFAQEEQWQAATCVEKQTHVKQKRLQGPIWRPNQVMEKINRINRSSRAIICALVFLGFEAFVQPRAPKTAPKTALRVKVFDFPFLNNQDTQMINQVHMAIIQGGWIQSCKRQVFSTSVFFLLCLGTM